MLRVGLTGGIASGKSHVSARLALHGAVVIDADLLAREVVAVGTPGLAAVVAAFGADVLASGGSLDRTAMAQCVFGDPTARQRLEEIVHPRVRVRAAEIEAAAPDDAVVVHDIPLLAETGQAERFDVVVVVDCPTDVQVERLIQRRKMRREEAQARIAAQASREERLAIADAVVSNAGSLEELAEAVDELWRGLARRAGRVGQRRPAD